MNHDAIDRVVIPHISLRPGAVVHTLANGELVFAWGARRVTLAGLSPALTKTLARLARSGATIDELASTLPVGNPFELARLYYFVETELAQRMLLRYALIVDERLILSVESMGQARFAPAALEAEQRVQLSRFSGFRREGHRLIVESPVSAMRAVLEWPGSAAVMAELAQPCTVAQLEERVAPDLQTMVGPILSYLVGAGIAGRYDDAGLAEDVDQTLMQWEYHDLHFHARSRMGRHDYPSGATYPFSDVIEPLSATKPPMSHDAVSLPVPELERLYTQDPTLTRVVESRCSRRHHDEEPLTLEQLGEFLYRVGRVRAQTERDPAGEPRYATTSRPYPSGGACYDLELYLTVRSCRGLRPGIYHYDPLGHRLHRLAEPGEAFDALLRDAAVSAGVEALPHVLITITSRFQRVSWKYRSIAYATTLKGKTVKLGIVMLCQGRLACEDVDAEGRLVALAIDSETLVGVAGQWPLDRAGTDP
jgi:SagB-type dehydrogenase family enzyme